MVFRNNTTPPCSTCSRSYPKNPFPSLWKQKIWTCWLWVPSSK